MWISWNIAPRATEDAGCPHSRSQWQSRGSSPSLGVHVPSPATVRCLLGVCPSPHFWRAVGVKRRYFPPTIPSGPLLSPPPNWQIPFPGTRPSPSPRDSTAFLSIQYAYVSHFFTLPTPVSKFPLITLFHPLRKIRRFTVKNPAHISATQKSITLSAEAWEIWSWG